MEPTNSNSSQSIELDIEFMKWFCSTEKFNINGVPAATSDFGDHYDDDPGNAPDYGCGDRVFVRKEASPEVLVKYNIGAEAYDRVCSSLEAGLSFGRCDLCA